MVAAVKLLVVLAGSIARTVGGGGDVPVVNVVAGMVRAEPLPWLGHGVIHRMRDPLQQLISPSPCKKVVSEIERLSESFEHLREWRTNEIRVAASFIIVERNVVPGLDEGAGNVAASKKVSKGLNLVELRPLVAIKVDNQVVEVIYGEPYEVIGDNPHR